MNNDRRAVSLTLAALGIAFASAAFAEKRSVVVYDDFKKPGSNGYTIVDYSMKWANPFGLGEMASVGGDTRSFKGNQFSLSAVPFRTGLDYSVFDHLKYAAFSTQSFAVPLRGSLTISSTIHAETPGTEPGRVINGTYIQSGLPYAQPAFEGQQAGAVMNMVDFGSGQLFDWFISGSRAFTLIERLPGTVTGNLAVDLNKAYTQIIDEFPITPGPQKVAIRYTP